MNKIIRKNSPNHFNGRKDWNGKVWIADMIVFHQTGGTDAAGAISWYMNPGSQCSPNFVIDKDGTIYCLVDIADGAWANGTSTSPSDNKYYGYSLNSIVRSRKNNANYYSYSIEFVHCQWGNITAAQEQAAIELIKEVLIPDMKAHGVTPQIDRNHLIGHSDVSPKTRDPEKFNCPGKYFPYDKIIAGVLGVEDVKTAPSATASEETTMFAVGDKVIVKTTATLYAGSSVKIPAMYKGKQRYTVDKLMSDRARLKELWSWVYLKDLEKQK